MNPDKYPIHNHHIGGLARKCPNCGTIAHFEVKGRKPIQVTCPICDHEFIVQKYKRGERPGAKKINP